MTAQEMWGTYSARLKVKADFQAWAFGINPDELAKLILDGIKTGTASAYPLYVQEKQDLPKAGDYSVILDSQDNAVCIIQTTKVLLVPFDEVDESHANKEGEGDRSLRYWRDVHEKFFKTELEAVGLKFNHRMKVVCEEFIKVFP